MSITIKGLNSSNYNFGSLSSIRKQAQAVADRKEIQRAELRAERERTGLIKNEKGEMVPVSSLSEKEISVLEERELKQSTTPQEALLAALATAPNSDEVELNKQMAAKATKMQNKLLQGKRVSGEEIRFLREHFPHLAAIADRMEQELSALCTLDLPGIPDADNCRRLEELGLTLPDFTGRKCTEEIDFVCNYHLKTALQAREYLLELLELPPESH